MRFIRQTKLSDWCLHVIISNLHHYIKGGSAFKKQLDFLLRLYSKEIYSRLKQLDRESEEFVLLFFLNPYNRVVRLSSISKRAVEQLQIVGSVITSLTLRKSLASENILSSVVCCVPNVTCLDLRQTNCSDKTLLCIQKMCPKLVSLNLYDCDRVTDVGMEYLSKSNLSIKDLDITYSNVKFDGLRTILKGMISLQRLKYYNIADILLYIHRDDIAALKTTRYNLTELVYEHIDFCLDPVEVIWACSVMCPNMKKMQFKFPVGKNVIKMCSNFQNLENLEVKSSYSHFISNVLSEILPLSNNLQRLSLASVNLDVITLVNDFKNLKMLSLTNVHFEGFNPKAVKVKETKLEILSYGNCNSQFSRGTLEALSLLISLSKNVTYLRFLAYIDLPPEIVCIILNSMKNLVCISFNFTNMTVEQLFCFLKMPSMKRVYLDLCTSFSLENYALRNIQEVDSTSTLSWRIQYNDIDNEVDKHDKNIFRISKY